MVHLEECLTHSTPVWVLTNQLPKKSLFRKKEKPQEYFLKQFNPAELIGEELCRIKNIRCAHYFIAGIGPYNLKAPVWYEYAQKYCSVFRIASKNFHEPDCTYKSAVQYGFSQDDPELFEKILTVAKDEENKKQLCMDMLQMLALDIYMGQTDRYAFNYEFEEDSSHRVRLAPLFDFQYSVDPQWLNEGDICFGDLYSFKTIEDCKEFIRKYPVFRDILSSYLGVDLEYVVRDAFSRRNMKMPEKKFEYYRQFDQDRKDMIHRIVD